MAVRIQKEAFDLGLEVARLHGADRSVGAITSFVGTVREVLGEHHTSLTLEHYPGMTEAALGDIEAVARERFDITQCLMVHRVGTLSAGEAIVLVIVTASHRGEAFRACEFLIDFLKTKAPFWKKEKSTAGEHWVESRDSDDAKAAAWESPRRG